MAGVLFIVTILTEAEEKKLNEPSYQLSSKDFSETLDEFENKENTDQANVGTDPQEKLISSAIKPRKSEISTANLKISNDAEKVVTENRFNPGTAEGNALKKSWDGFKEIVSSAKIVKKRLTDEDAKLGDRSLNVAADATMEQIMVEMLRKLKIDNAVWQLSRNSNCYQITFTLEANNRHETVLNILNEWGIGERTGSNVSMIPLAIYNRPNIPSSEEKTETEENLIWAQKETAWNRFMNSIRARLNVAQIVQEVKQDATLTFDFVTLVIVAGCLAAFGLVENSTIFLAASMLISPLMGPILATTFGIVIKDNPLIRFGLVNEIIGILLATCVGFFFGLIVCSIDSRYVYGSGEGLTEEMTSRCEWRSLLVGVFTALPSGAAVAIAILGENIGSLVGVAISASLLPPAVNSGVLWALAMLHVIYSNDPSRFNKVIQTNYYSDNQAVELIVYGSISLLLTLINIVCILLMGVLVLKFKEVAPVSPKYQRQFWKYDIKVARDYNKTCHTEDDLLAQKLAEEITEYQANDTDHVDLSAELLRNMSRTSYQNTWSPVSNRHSSHRSKPSIADLEKICMHMAIPGNRMPSFGGSKTIIGKSWSPPKYRSLLEDHIFPVNSIARRSSMPYASSFNMPTYGLGHPSHTFKGTQLGKISETHKGSQSSDGKKHSFSSLSTSDEREPSTSVKPPTKKSRKFIVTPAPEPHQ